MINREKKGAGKSILFLFIVMGVILAGTLLAFLSDPVIKLFELLFGPR